MGHRRIGTSVLEGPVESILSIGFINYFVSQAWRFLLEFLLNLNVSVWLGRLHLFFLFYLSNPRRSGTRPIDNIYIYIYIFMKLERWRKEGGRNMKKREAESGPRKRGEEEENEAFQPALGISLEFPFPVLSQQHITHYLLLCTPFSVEYSNFHLRL